LKNPREDFALMDVFLSTVSGSHDQALQDYMGKASTPSFSY
jgi:hypothetical protein